MTPTPASTSQPREPFDLTSGALCLDLANTLSDRPRATQDRLGSYEDLLCWGGEAGILDDRQIRDLSEAARRHERQAGLAFERAIDLRETLYELFSPLAKGLEPECEAVDALNATLRTALPNLEIQCLERGIVWVWSGDPTDLDRVLWPVARSAADLLTSEEAVSVRECASGTCSWLFVDRSRNRRRKWCDMATCGNRAKARRQYERKKRQSEGTR